MPDEQVSLRARMAAHMSWSTTQDRTSRTQAARNGFLKRFEQQVDPEGKLSAAERRKRADSAFKAHMAKLALKSLEARRRKGKVGK